MSERTVKQIDEEIKKLQVDVKDGTLDAEDLPGKIAELIAERDKLQETNMKEEASLAKQNARLQVAFANVAPKILGEKKAKEEGMAHQTFWQMCAKAINKIRESDTNRFRELATDDAKLNKFFEEEVGKEYTNAFGKPADAPKEKDPEREKQLGEARDAVEESKVGDTAEDNRTDASKNVNPQTWARNDEEMKALDKLFEMGDEDNGENAIEPEEVHHILTAFARHEEAEGVPENQRSVTTEPARGNYQYQTA